MRLDNKRLSGDPAGFLCLLHERGIDTHHSSFEYDSHSIYLDALHKAKATGRTFQHIVKLSDPSFDAETFDGSRLSALVDRELTTLGAETLASVQWLVRTTDPQDTATRIKILEDQRDEIILWAESQVAAGKIQNLSVFPYSMPFAEASVAGGITATMTTYLNLAELEAVSLLDESAGFIALRPLAGGRLSDPSVPDDAMVNASAARTYLEKSFDTKAERIAEALRFPLLHPATTSIVVSVNSVAHLDQAVDAAGAITPDLARFESVSTAVG